jgi:uncharacterized protein involved in exopolysaccharide biosynthesis
VEYTDRHPRILTLQETIASLEARCAEEIQSSPLSSPSFPVATAEPLEANPVYQNMRIQLSNAEVELASLRAELVTRRRAVEQLRLDVDKIVEVETELKQLNRDYEVVQTRHQELLRRWEDLQAKKRLDPVTDRVQFRRIEPPFALAEPVGPNRPLLLVGLLVVAGGIGIAVALGLSQLHPAYFTGRSLSRAVELPVLGSVSLILTPQALAKRRAAIAVWLGAAMTLLACTAVVIVFAAPGSAALRTMIMELSA